MTKKEIFAYLRQNKDILKMSKKSSMKKADGVAFNNSSPHFNFAFTKKSGQNEVEENFDKIKLNVVINTSNILDAHGDVHIGNIWKKSINDNKNFYLLQEHEQTFKGVICDKMTAKVENLSFAKLGVNYQGNTDALIFEGDISKYDNPYMFAQYQKAKVKQHSVGMYYVKMFMCLNSDDRNDAEEKENFDKYYPFIANKNEFEDIFYFWAITEAKLIEGSAVLFGSNSITPTNFVEPFLNTQKRLNEPSNFDTQKNKKGWDIFKY